MLIDHAEMQRRLDSSRNLVNTLNIPVLIRTPDAAVPDVPIVAPSKPKAPSISIPLSVPPNRPAEACKPGTQGGLASGVHAKGESKPVTIDLPTQKLAASLVKQGVAIHTVAQELGISVADIKKAQAQPEVRSSVEHTMERVRELALDKLLLNLGLMSADKFENASLKELASSASALSRVISSAAPQGDRDSAGLRLVIYAPQVRAADHYKVIDV